MNIIHPYIKSKNVDYIQIIEERLTEAIDKNATKAFEMKFYISSENRHATAYFYADSQEVILELLNTKHYYFVRCTPIRGDETLIRLTEYDIKEKNELNYYNFLQSSFLFILGKGKVSRY
jgi:hypothetical protein